MQWLAAANLFSLFLTAYFQLLIFKDLMLFEYFIFLLYSTRGGQVSLAQTSTFTQVGIKRESRLTIFSKSYLVILFEFLNFAQRL